MSRLTCKTCRHFDAPMREGGLEDEGLCRAYAPRHMTESEWGIWPAVRDHDWCGEWEEDPAAPQRAEGHFIGLERGSGLREFGRE